MCECGQEKPCRVLCYQGKGLPASYGLSNSTSQAQLAATFPSRGPTLPGQLLLPGLFYLYSSLWELVIKGQYQRRCLSQGAEMTGRYSQPDSGRESGTGTIWATVKTFHLLDGDMGCRGPAPSSGLLP